VASTVDVDGVRTCAACFVGLTPLVRAGIPIVATVAELAPQEPR
jgi:hypothetical protein